MLGQALTDVWLAKGDLKQAGPEAERFLELTLATAERTWQALAWEASARVAMAGGDHHRASTCIDNALSAMEGFEVPLAAWRVHASAAELETRRGNQRAAGRHRCARRRDGSRLGQILWWITNVSAQHSLRRRRCARS